MYRIQAVLALGVALLVAGCTSKGSGDPVAQSQAGLDAVEQQKLQAPDRAPHDQLGTSVAIDGDIALLGMPSDDNSMSSEAGSVYVFERTGTTWAIAQRLAAPEDGSCIHFGQAVALTGDTAFVACPDTDRPEGLPGVYVFARQAGAWPATQRISPLSPSEPFGHDLAAFNDTLVIAGNDTNVFVHDATHWVPQQTLAGPVDAVAVEFDTLVATNTLDDEGRGRATLYKRVSGSWSKATDFAGNDPGDHFGNDVALDGTTLMIAARDDFTDGSPRGTVYVVEFTTGWFVQQKLTGSDEGSGDAFGASVALRGERAVVGAALHEHFGENANSGAAYLFERGGSTWFEQREFRGTDGQNNDFFGSAVALTDSTVLVGAPNDDDAYAAVGCGYAYTLLRTFGEDCGSTNDCVDGLFCKDNRCCDETCEGIGPKTCLRDGDCTTEQYCSAIGVCQPKKARGRACEPAAGADCATNGCNVCETGSCVDGFCCEERCDLGCFACARFLTGEANGTCAPVRAGTDPREVCEAGNGAGACGGDGNCDGHGACRASAAAGTRCGALSCAPDGISDFACDGAGHCIEETLSCDTGSDCSTNPCQNGGTCASTPGGGHTCTCLPGINGANCEIVFTELASTYSGTCGLRSDGKVVCWQDDDLAADPPTGRLTSIDAGSNQLCGVDSSGGVHCFGNDQNSVVPAEPFSNVSVSAGGACGVRTDGTLGVWGGLADFGPPPTGTYRLAKAGVFHGCAIRTDDTVACWGLRGIAGVDFGQMDPPPGTFQALGAAVTSTCGLRTDGSIACWGQSGSGGPETPPTGTFVSLAFDEFRGCAIRTDQTLACWNTDGFVGPTPSGTFLAVTVGSFQPCAIRTDHSVVCWGVFADPNAIPTGQL